MTSHTAGSRLQIMMPVRLVAVTRAHKHAFDAKMNSLLHFVTSEQNGFRTALRPIAAMNTFANITTSLTGVGVTDT